MITKSSSYKNTLLDKRKVHPFEHVSVVITAMTDAEKPFINECVASVFRNSFILEVIICVNNTNSWIETELIRFSNNPKLKVHRIDKCNASKARNYGVKVSNSSWIAFCDGDDVWSDHKIKRQLEHACLYKSDVVGGDHYLTCTDGIIRAYAICKNMPMTSSWLVKKDIICKNPFDENLNKSEDSEWWVRMGDRVKKGRCPYFMLFYRVRSKSLSDNSASKRRKALVVKLGSIPVLNKLILLSTYVSWLLLRKTKYNL